jgi:hypothetical protein
MRTLFILLIMASIMSFSAPLLAASSQRITADAEMTKVELFTNGAQVYKTVRFQAKEEVLTFLVKDIPTNIDPSTIRAKALEGQKIVSIGFETDYEPTIEDRRRVKALKDSLEHIRFDIALKRSELDALHAQSYLLDQNTQVLDNRLGSEELENILAIHDRKRLAIKQGIVRVKRVLQEMETKESALSRSFEQQSNRDNPLAGIIRVEVVANPGKQNSFELSYLVPDAYWIPQYDIRVNSIFAPITLEYRAEVYQHSHEDWDDVELLLFNNDPHRFSMLQDLKPWKVYPGSLPPTYKEYTASTPPSRIEGEDGVLKGAIREVDGLPIPFANVAVKQNGKLITGSSTDFDGEFRIESLEPGFYDIEISSLGFAPQFISDVRVMPAKTTFYNGSLSASAVSLDEFVVVEYKKPLIESDAAVTRESVYSMSTRNTAELAATAGGTYSKDLNVRGGRSSANHYYIDGIKVRGSNAGFATEPVKSREEIRMEFKAPGKQYIPSSEQRKMVYLKSAEVAANYIYRSIPKVIPEVYLYAEISSWDTLDLISGKVNLYYENTFVGESFIDAQSTNDTLGVSLGIVNDVKVERERLEDEVDRTAFGGERASVGWKLSVKSNKAYPIQFRLEDQVPLSSSSYVKIDLVDDGGAQLDEKSGKLTWEFKLVSASKEERSFRYEVDYPKSVAIYLE